MFRIIKLRTLLILITFVGLVGCMPDPGPTPTPTKTPVGAVGEANVSGVVPTVDAAAAGVAAEPTLTPTPPPPSGPTGYPANVDPLTGLYVDDPAVLDRPPLLVKISNNPEIVRPQAGLMAADHVWEHQTEGYALTRFTAVLLGQTPPRVGSVRSGRLPDMELVPMYQGIFYASGFSSNRHDKEGPKRMFEIMLNAPWYSCCNYSADFGYGEPYGVRFPQEGLSFEHTLFAIPEELWKLAKERGVGPSPTLDPGLAFDQNVPANGIPTTEMKIDYPGRGPECVWKYDEVTGKWLRWTDGAAHGDALTGSQLAFDNVVIVWAQHFDADYIEDETANLHGVEVILTGEGDAVLLRNGQRFDVRWKREKPDDMIQFFDINGNVIPFKHGNTWFHTASWNVAVPDVTYLP